MALKLKRGPNPVSVVIDNTSQGGASIVKVEQWNNPQPLTLLEVMQNLMDMDLSIVKASNLSSPEMTTQYFEVTDCKGKKVVNDKSIAFITKNKHSKKDVCPPRVVVFSGESKPLVYVSNELANMDYKIEEASIEYLGPYKFLKGRVTKIEDIKIGTDNKEMGNMKKILDVAIERGCVEGYRELIVFGPREELHDFIRSLMDVYVTGGQVYHNGGVVYFEFPTFPLGYLKFFVSF